MNRHETTSELYRLADKIAATTCGFDAMSAAANEIRLASKALQRINERECNGIPGPDGYMKWDDEDQERADKQRERHEKRVIEALGSAFALNILPLLDIEFQGDPRGAPVIVHTKGKQDRLATFY